MSELGNQLSLDTKMADVDDFLKEGIWSPDAGDDLWSFGSELATSDNFLEVFADLSNSCDFLLEVSERDLSYDCRVVILSKFGLPSFIQDSWF